MCQCEIVLVFVQAYSERMIREMMQWWNGKDECLLACIFIFDCTGTDNFYAFANCRYYALRTSIEHSLCLFYDVHVDSLKFELLTCTDSSSIFLSNSALFVSVRRFQLVCICVLVGWIKHEAQAQAAFEEGCIYFWNFLFAFHSIFIHCSFHQFPICPIWSGIHLSVVCVIMWT